MRLRAAVLFTGVLAVAAVGCSKSESNTNTGGGGTTTTSASVPATSKPSGTTPGTTAKTSGTTPGSTPGTAPSSVKVSLKETPLGKILVDAKGMTIYVFMKDSGTTVACNGACATAWPAVQGTSVEPGTGLGDDDFTSIKGQDGVAQIAFYGHPLYTYAGDNAPGDTNGQGFANGNWYVVGADGQPIKTAK